MYNNVGGEIKGWAKFIVILVTILSAILGGMLFSILFGDFVSRILLGALVGGVVGYFIGRIFAIFMYAFGELVESVNAIKEDLRRRSIGNAPAADKQAPPPIEKSMIWICKTCGERHDKGENLCNKCNTPR